MPRLIHALPPGHRWDRVPWATLLGDAAHLKPPDGEGANNEMYDGAELGKAIAANLEDLEAALIAYETKLFTGSMSASAEAHKTFEAYFGDDAPQSLLDFLQSNQTVKWSPCTRPNGSIAYVQSYAPIALGKSHARSQRTDRAYADKSALSICVSLSVSSSFSRRF